MRTLQTLLDEAVNKCAGPADLARKIGVHRSEISEMTSGRRPVSPAMVGLLCDVLELDGLEAQRLAAEATIATAKPEKQGVLRRAFFACWAIGVACGVGMPTTSDARTATGQPGENVGTKCATMYRRWRAQYGECQPAFGCI